jgi:hypothetical protein
MTAEELTAKLDTLEGQLTEATKRADRAEAIMALTGPEREGFGKLDSEKQEEFLKADADAREEILKSLEPPPPVVPEEVQKRLDDISKKLEVAEKRAADAEKVAKAERDAREITEFAKLAETEYPGLPGTPEEKGAVLKAMKAKMTMEECEAAMKLMKAGNACLTAQMGSVGKDAPATGDSAWAKIEQKADALMAADTKLSKAQAISEVCKRNPELYDAYNREAPKQAS